MVKLHNQEHTFLSGFSRFKKDREGSSHLLNVSFLVLRPAAKRDETNCDRDFAKHDFR